MPKTLAMHQVSLAHIGERLAALGLDLDIVTFDDTGHFDIAGRRVPAAEAEADYVWLSSHLPNRQATFGHMLEMKRIGVLQTFNAGLDDPVYAQLAAKGVTICNSSAQGVAIAEFVIGQVMAVLQPIEQQRAQQAAREWKITRYREISRTNWLIVGFGPSGRRRRTGSRPSAPTWPSSAAPPPPALTWTRRAPPPTCPACWPRPTWWCWPAL